MRTPRLYVDTLPSKINIEHLAIETTRRCNMRCDHCLRGNAEDVDMSTAHIRTLLGQVNRIGEVAFTGGEPSLNLMAIRKFFEIAKENHIIIDSFFVATNGKENQEELALLLLKLYQIVEIPDDCVVALSIDPFHDENINPIVKGLGFYSSCKEHDPTSMTNLYWITKTGRAAEYGLGKYSLEIPKDFTISWSYDEHDRINPNSISIEDLYLSCNGYLYTCADMTYTDMDSRKDTHVRDLTSLVLQEIAKEQA